MPELLSNVIVEPLSAEVIENFKYLVLPQSPYTIGDKLEGYSSVAPPEQSSKEFNEHLKVYSVSAPLLKWNSFDSFN